eukprot:610526_1
MCRICSIWWHLCDHSSCFKHAIEIYYERYCVQSIVGIIRQWFIAIDCDNCVMYAGRGDWFIIHPQYFEWYMFFGGMFGAFVVTMFIICPPFIGFVTTYICSIFGSMVTSLVFDSIGAFGVQVQKQDQMSMGKVGGIIIVLMGAILVNIRRANKHKEVHESMCLMNLEAKTNVQDYGID